MNNFPELNQVIILFCTAVVIYRFSLISTKIHANNKLLRNEVNCAQIEDGNLLTQAAEAKLLNMSYAVIKNRWNRFRNQKATGIYLLADFHTPMSIEGVHCKKFVPVRKIWEMKAHLLNEDEKVVIYIFSGKKNSFAGIKSYIEFQCKRKTELKRELQVLVPNVDLLGSDPACLHAALGSEHAT